MKGIEKVPKIVILAMMLVSMNRRPPTRNTLLGVTTMILAGLLIVAGSASATLEYGDAPDPKYPSLLGSDGVRHNNQSNTECLGLNSTGDWKDFEPDARVSDLDNPFDDGLITMAIATGNPAATVTFEVTDLMAPSDLWVNILIDLDRNGDWTGPGEHVVVNQLIAVPASELVVVSTPFSTVGAAPGKTWLRMTLTRCPIPNPLWNGTMADTGLGWDRFEHGETEDCEIEIYEPEEVPAMTPPAFLLALVSLIGLVVFATREVNKR